MDAHRRYRTLLVEASGPVLTIVLNRPERRNPIGVEMVNELVWALDDAKDDPDVRVVVLTGAGQVFSAGGDLKQMSIDDEGLPVRGDFVDLLLRFTTLGKPTIAKVRGPAMGGALGLVASCDFAVASTGSTFGTPEISRGLFPFMIMAVLRRVVSRRRLLDMMLLGESLDAATAASIELVSKVVGEAELDAEVESLAAKLASRSPTALRMGLQAFHAHADHDLATALPALRDQLGAILGTEDGREGLMAFLEKRAPRWTGR